MPRPVSALRALSAGLAVVCVLGVGGVVAAAVVALSSRAWVVRRSSPFVTRAGVAGGAGAMPRPVPAAGAVVVGAVLGAGLRPDGSPTELLARRVEAGVALYRAGAVQRLVMSGAAEGFRDQPAAMARHAVALGVPDHHIELDRRGVDTASTCRELVAARGPGATVVVVTQEFHIHRAVYLARRAGLAAHGYASPDGEVRPAAVARARTREIPAAAKAVFVDRMTDRMTNRMTIRGSGAT